MSGSTNLRDANVVTQVFARLLGKTRVRLNNKRAQVGSRRGLVLDHDGTVMGEAYDTIYGARGFSVWTEAYAGFVPNEQIEFVP